MLVPVGCFSLGGGLGVTISKWGINNRHRNQCYRDITIDKTKIEQTEKTKNNSRRRPRRKPPGAGGDTRGRRETEPDRRQPDKGTTTKHVHEFGGMQ